jgi:FdhD protein
MIARTAPATVTEVRGVRHAAAQDQVAIEAPLEIRVRAGGEERAISITMRTPGEDDELAVGFLFTEGLLHARAEVAAVRAGAEDQVVVELAPGVPAPAPRASRAFTTTSACGVCGRGSLDDLRAPPPGPLLAGAPVLTEALIHGLPGVLRAAQATFATTGGLHGAGLFDAAGTLLLCREDVGRHNAVDKVVGARWLAGALPAATAILAVSGRASFELVQKALMAQIPVLAAVGAPSSLAVSLAAEAGMTLLGFVREDRFVVYSGPERFRHA